MAASADITVHVADAKPVRELIEADRRLVRARAAGADVFEASAEVDEIEWALARLDGITDAICSECGAPFEIRHQHAFGFQWVRDGG